MNRVIDTPIGPLTLVAGEGGLQRIDFGHRDGPADEGVSAAAAAHLDRAQRQLGEYFAGRRTMFDVALDPQGTAFQLRAWAVLRTIPFGTSISYADQARQLGGVNLSRAVGSANGRNPLPIVVPCHRVVGSNGRLTGFAGGLPAKAWLLDHEQSVVAEARPG